MTKNSNTRPRMRHVKWRVLLGKNMSEISNHTCAASVIGDDERFIWFSALPIYEEEAEWHTYFKVILMLKLACFKWCLCLWLYTLFKGTRNGLSMPDGSMCQSLHTEQLGRISQSWLGNSGHMDNFGSWKTLGTCAALVIVMICDIWFTSWLSLAALELHFPQLVLVES